MPLYTYRCSSCQTRLERRQRFDEAPLERCPDCGGRLTRLIQPVGIIFKGSGFYSTDHRSSSAGSKSSETSSENGKKSDGTEAVAASKS